MVGSPMGLYSVLARRGWIVVGLTKGGGVAERRFGGGVGVRGRFKCREIDGLSEPVIERVVRRVGVVGGRVA